MSHKWKMTFKGYQPPDLKRIRIKMLDCTMKSKELDQQMLTLSALRTHHLNKLDEIQEDLEKIKSERSEVIDKYLDVYDDFKDCQSYYLKR